jgi:membrane associated rhomboid family serine protease
MTTRRSSYGGGGYGGGGMTLSLPPFTPMVKWLLGINTGVFLLMALLGAVAPGAVSFIIRAFALRPTDVAHGALWQLVTYSFLHLGFWHWFGNMLALWMFGSAIEGMWHSRRFLELFTVGVVGAALFSVIISYSGVLGGPGIATVGASGGVYAILIAFGMVLGDNEIMLIPFPFMIRAKYFIAILIVLTVFFSLQDTGQTNNLAHLGGLFFGFLYVKFSPRGGLRVAGSEGYYGLRNSYYRWKRRRAARKFEVYMREHKREDYFDQYGNFKDPEQKGPAKGDGENSKGNWVN